MHAFEVLAEVAPTTTTPRAVELCDWLAAISLPDGGLLFALPSTDRAGNAPLWVEPNTPVSSLQMTTQVAANAHLVGRHHADVAGHGWLSRATQWCLTAIDSLDTAPHAYELLFVIRFLDAVAEVEPAAAGCSTGSASTCRPTASSLSRGRRRRGDPTARLRAPAQRPGKAAVLRGSDRGRAAPADRRARARRWVDCRICVGFARSDARVAWVCDRPRGRPPPCRGPMNPRFGRRAG
jgi:hypothetical protein